MFFKVCNIFFKLLLLRNLWLESDNVSLGLDIQLIKSESNNFKLTLLVTIQIHLHVFI